MSPVPARSNSAFFSYIIAAFSVIALTLVLAASAGAQADTFLNGDGHDGTPPNFGASTFVPNSVAPIPGALSAGASSVTIGAIRAGSGTGNVTFNNNRLVMIYQSNGVVSAPTSGNQTAYSLTSSTAGHWEFARVQTVAGSILTLTAPLINSYAAGTSQAIAVPEWAAMTVNNAAAVIEAPNWNGTSGGVISFLVSGTANFSAAGTVSASSFGLRGGVTYNENPGGVTGCLATQYNSPGVNGTYGMKGEGFYAAGYQFTTPATATTQQGRGNYLNAGGGGNCFNAGGGGGGNGGQGGVGGNSLVGYTNGNQPVGGLGGAALTYSPADKLPLGGGGGGGERNNANNGRGGFGGGVVMVRGGTLSGSGNFRANGGAGAAGNLTSTPYDGAGGGGSGGVVVLRFVNGATCTGVSANGAVGGANANSGPYNWTPGGGGGGGKTYVQGSAVTCPQTATGGANGTNGGNAYGASSGGAGTTTSNATGLATPIIAITAPTAASYQPSATPTISGTSTNNATIYIYVDGVYSGTTTASGAGAWSYVSPSMSNGAHTVSAYSQLAGIDSATANRTFTVDTITPTLALTAPANGAIVNTTTPTVTYSLTETNQSVSTFCIVDGGAPVACTSGSALAALSQGSHTLQVRHTDLAGNVGNSATNTFTVDSINPVVSLTAPANGSATNDTTPTVTFSVTETNPVTSRCIVDGVLPGTVCTTGSSLAALTPGPHTLQISHTDLAGNVGTSATNTFTVDTTAPAVSITSPASNGLTIAPSGNLTFTATDAVGPVTTTCQIDGGAAVSCTSPFAFSGLSDGAHTFTVTATDGGGNSTALVRSITVDATPPNTNITANPALVTNSTTGTFSFTSTEGSSTFECVIDSVPIASCSSPISYPGLTQGSHTFQVRATDQYGNVDASPATYTWTIDTTAPIAPTISTPGSDIYTSDTTPAIGGLSEPGSTVNVYEGVTLIGTALADGSGVWALSPDPTLSVGPHALIARATDPAGNVSADSSTRTIVVDTAAPTVSLTAPANGAFVNTTTPTVTFSLTETNPGTSRCIVDGVLPGTVCTTGSSLAALSEGSHTLAISHTDLAGNVGTSATNTFTVDTTNPVVSLTAPANGSSTNDTIPTVTFSVTETNPGTSRCIVDGVLPGTVCTTGSSLAALSEGSHTLAISHTDLAGNVGTSATNTFTVDTTAPVAPAITTPAPATSYTSDTTPTVAGTAEANSTVNVYDGVTLVGTTTASAVGAWTLDTSVLATGSHSITATATDAAGNVSPASGIKTIVIDTTAPTVALTAPANGSSTNDTTPTVTFSVTETNPGTSRCIVDGVLPGTVCTTGSSLAALSEGSHTLAISHTDLAGNVGTSATNTFTVDTTAPVAPAITTPAPATSYTSDTTPTVAGTAEANSTVNVYDGVTLVGTTTASAVGAWTLDTSVLATGSHSITATATDAAGNVSPASGIKTIVIDTTAPTVALTAPANGSTVGTTTPTVTFSVTDANPGTSRCIVDGVLPGTVCTTGSSLAALSEGSHTLAISHTDLAGNVGTSATNTFTVDATAPVAPAITTPAAATTYTSDTTPTVAGTAEANSTVNVYDGVTLVGTTTASAVGAWTLDTSVLATGLHSITATATDAAGNVSPASGIKTIVIDTTNPVVSLTAPANGSATNETTPTVTFSVTETNPGTSRCIVDGVLPGTVCTTGSSLAALTPGSHTLAISHTDLAGNVATSATNTFTVDTTAPAVSITFPAIDGMTIAPSGNLTFTATDAVGPVTTTCQIDGGAAVSCTSPFAFSGLSDGAHTFTVTATDGGGNSTALVRSITVDATPPNTNITANPALVTNSTTGTFSFTSTEGSSTFECVIDSVPIASCSSPISYPGLTQGSHTFQVRATDQYGNVDASPATYTWTIDTTAPIAPTISTPGSDIYTSDTTPAIGGLSEPGSTVNVYEGVTLIGTALADGSGVWALSPDPTLSVGPHALIARATDPAGNVSADSSTRTIVVDTAAPTVSLTAPANGSTVGTTTPTITFSVVDTNPSAASSCVIDGGAPVVCTSGYIPGALSQGSHTVVVSHTDLAGNVGTSATNTFTVDTVAPGAPVITSGPSAPVASTTAAFGFTGEVGATYECYIDSPATWAPCSSPETYSSLGQGAHTFHVRQTDAGGNVSPESTRSWSVDTVGPPAPSVTGPSGTVGTTSATINFSDTESPVTFMCSLDGSPAALCTSPVSLSGLSDGAHSYEVYAIDVLGNSGASTTINWTVDSSLFTAGITAGPLGTVATSDNSLSFTATILPGTTFMCRVDAGTFASCTSPFATGALPDGSHTFEVYAVNGSQNSATVSRTWSIDTAGPSVSISAPTDGQTVGPNGNVLFSSTDATGPVTYTCQLDGGTAVSCGSPFVFTGLTDGAHSVTVTATDGVSNSSVAVRNFIVDATPPQTTIIASPPAETSSSDATFGFSSSEIPSTFECQLDAGPIGPCTSTTDYTGLAEGSHTFSVRAIDQYGNVDQSPSSYSWTVDQTAPVAPSISTPPADIVTTDTTPAVGGLSEPNSTVSVYDGVTLIGTAVADGSGNWSLSPDPTFTEGPHVLTATATDASGNTSGNSTTRTITIDLTDPNASISSPLTGAYVNTASPDITFTATDTNLASVVCSLDGAPAVACTSPWATSGLSEGLHTVVVLATDGAGRQATASTTFTVDLTNPDPPVITSPGANLVTVNQTPSLAGTAEPLATITIYDNGVQVDTVVADGAGDWSWTSPTTVSEAAHPYTVTATDQAGNVSNVSNTRTITVDLTAPLAPVITSPATDISTSNVRPPIGGTSEANALISVYDGATLLGTTFANGSGDWSFTPAADLPEGAHVFTATATDAADNTGPASGPRTITIDTTAPAAPAITTPASDLVTGVNTQPISGTAEALSTVTVYDGATQIGTATTDGSGNWSLSPDPTFTEGVHTITAWATDAAGNTSVASQNRVITIDDTAPAKPVITSPTTGAKLGDSTPTVTGTAEPGSTVDVYDGATLICSDTADISGDWSCTPSTPLTEGDHTLTAKATDPSGNQSPASDDVDVTIDVTNPSVSISSPTGGSTVTTQTPAVSFTATDSNLDTVECKVDSGSYAPCISPWTTPSLSDGSHTVTVRATDQAGNVATAASTFTVDTTAPTTTIGTTPSALTNDPTPTFTFTSNDPGATFECRIGSGAFAPCTSPFTGGPLTDGSHTFEVRAIDTNGNVESPAKSYSFTVDTTPPVKPLVTAPTAGITTTDNTPTISGTAEANSTVEVFVDGISIGTATTNGSGNWTITSTSLTDGPHNATARATDAAGNTGATSDPVAFTVDTTPPGGTVSELPPAGGPGTNPTFEISTPDPAATIACALDGGASAPCSSPFTPAGTLAVGTHTLVVTFTDPSGNVTTRTITFVIAGKTVTPPPSDPTQCLGGGVVITDLFPKGKKATVSGFARADLIGKSVTITYLPTKKAVATALVKSDGSFSTTFKTPPKKDWNKNTTTYLASAGGFKSKKTKLVRRVSSTVVNYSGGKLTVSGAVTLPLVKGGGATIKAKTGCTGTFKVIGTTKFKPNGAFSFTTPYVGSGVIFVQVNAVIGNPSVKNKKFKTNSFVVPVVVK